MKLCLGFRRGKQLWAVVSVSSPLGRVGRRDCGDLDQIIGYWFAAAIIGRRDLGDLDQIIGY